MSTETFSPKHYIKSKQSSKHTWKRQKHINLKGKVAFNPKCTHDLPMKRSRGSELTTNYQKQTVTFLPSVTARWCHPGVKWMQANIVQNGTGQIAETEPPHSQMLGYVCLRRAGLARTNVIFEPWPSLLLETNGRKLTELTEAKGTWCLPFGEDAEAMGEKGRMGGLISNSHFRKEQFKFQPACISQTP